MSDQTKDFRYYADKAEEYLADAQELDGTYTRQAAEILLKVGAVYAELAKAAPQAEPAPRSNFFYFVDGKRVEGQRCHARRYGNPLVDPRLSYCVHNEGHANQHKTADGDEFDA
jgi:hypothetical protein